MIAGVVGAPSSVTSIQVANLLKLFKIPQVGDVFLSTTPPPKKKKREREREDSMDHSKHFEM